LHVHVLNLIERLLYFLDWYLLSFVPFEALSHSVTLMLKK